MKKRTMQFKHKVVRDLLGGMSYADANEKYKCSIPQLRGWKSQYKDDVATRVDAPSEDAPAPVREFRKERIPMREQALLSLANKDPNYIYRGVVEDDRRIGAVEKYKLAGWEHITKDEGATIVGSSLKHGDSPGAGVARGSGLGSTTYFMRKRKDWEEEDLKKISKKADASEEAIFGELKKPGRFGSITLGGRTEEQRR